MPSRRSPRSTMRMMLWTTPIDSATSARRRITEISELRLTSTLRTISSAPDKGGDAQKRHRPVESSRAKAVDVLETRLPDAGDPAANHGVSNLGHAAGSFGDAGHLDAGVGTEPRDRPGVPFDEVDIDADCRCTHPTSLPVTSRSGRFPASTRGSSPAGGLPADRHPPARPRRP